MSQQKPCVLSIAGSDSSGGAGIQADIKAITATGAYAASAITVITAQNTTTVTDIFALPLPVIAAQIDAVFADLKVKTIKIGMLYREDIMLLVKERLDYWQAKKIILDPVMIAQTGVPLIDDNAMLTLKSLLPMATLLTPNIPEANFLLGRTINHHHEMIAAAQQLGEQYAINVLLKGGHLSGQQCDDIFFDYTSGNTLNLPSPRINTRNTHGTGCTLASAIASYLAQGETLANAIRKGKTYISEALKAACIWQLGKGAGPVDHFYNY